MRKTLLLAAMLLSTPLAAQTNVPGDPHVDDPVGIVADPCPAHPQPTNGQGWLMWNLHMLTRDFGQLCRYRVDNAALKARGQRVDVVFIGDSITDNWIGKDPGLFTGGVVDRGISGQTTPQMLVRFQADVVDLHPRAVHIMAGTNDVAGNTGAATMVQVQNNVRSMAEIARAHGIAVLLASVPPAIAFPWSPGKQPMPQIRALNTWLRSYATANGFTYVDYWPVLATPEGGMRAGLASDGVHPTAAGYRAMDTVARRATARFVR